MDFNKTFHNSLGRLVLPMEPSETKQGSRSGQTIHNGSIQIWFARYCDLDPFYSVLSRHIIRSEQEIAATFRQPLDARCFELRHGLLRMILGKFSRHEPEELVIIKGETGKPSLDPSRGYPVFSFSTSCTKEMVAIGITTKCDIGIDIVKMDRQYPFQDTAEYLFTDEEKALIAGKGPNQRYRHFFRIWAMKEALLKATGGTARMMSDMNVTGILNTSIVHDFFVLSYQNTQYRFFIHEFSCGFEHHCAIAVNLGKNDEACSEPVYRE